MVSTSHASTHPSTTPSLPSTTHSTHGSTADTLSLIDRGTTHQSEASRSDASLAYDDSISSSSTTRGADDDIGANIFDIADNYTTSPSSATPATEGHLVRNLMLSTQNYAAAVGNMGGQFTAAGAGEGTMVGEAEEGETQQPMMMLEDVPVVPAVGGEWGREEVDAARRNRAEMIMARWVMFPAGEVSYIRGGQ